MDSATTRFDQPLTIAKAIELVATSDFVLPGIQRSFVWKPHQIAALFDSLMRGYPLGSILVWRTRPVDHKQLRFRRLVTNYDGTSSIPPAAHPSANSWIHAVLDGQQRLTAFNIGLRGDYVTRARSEPRRLYLNLNAPSEDPGAEANQYVFDFRSKGGEDSEGAWFCVKDALTLSLDRATLSRTLQDADLKPTVDRRRVLARLVRILTRDRVLRVEVERSDNLDRVLNIFARANTGGTKLTYVDLLVSTATARWQDRDAKAEFETLRSAMNRTGDGFKFTPDRLVKAGLVLLDATETKFHVDSFSKGNKARELEIAWPEFSQAMTTAATTLASFGLSDKTLTAENVIIPVAYYVKHRHLRPTYTSAHRHENDRELVRAFVARTLLRRGYWTGAVDPVLVAVRRAIREHGAAGFPLREIEEALHSLEKPITADSRFINSLCDLKYGDRRTLLLLRLLSPALVAPEGFDKDHVFPVSLFSHDQLLRKGFSADLARDMADKADLLPNLQLLDSTNNRGGGKSDTMPKVWLKGLSPSARRRYTDQGVKNLPGDLQGVIGFWNRRRELLRERIADLLCAEVT